MKKILFVLSAFYLILTMQSFAQDDQFQNTVSFELGGKGLLYSFNYEYQFLENYVASVGFSALNFQESEIDKSSLIMSFPISAYYLLELNDIHYAEFGLSLMNLISSGDLVEYSGQTDYFLNPGLLIGYRFQPSNSRWHFKLTISPFLGTSSLTESEGTAFQPLGSRFQIWGGLSVGYRF